MNIQSAKYQQSQVNFKSAFPVVCWVKNADNELYSPAATSELAGKLQRKLVNAINKQIPDKNYAKNAVISKIKNHIADFDPDYNISHGHVRSFYVKKQEKNQPFAYMLSGDDADVFAHRYGKDIGRAKKYARQVLGTSHSAEAMEAVHKYYIAGLNFIKQRLHPVKNYDGTPLALHVKYIPIRNSKGEIKDYELIDARFCPASGQNSPLFRYRQLHSSDSFEKND